MSLFDADEIDLAIVDAVRSSPRASWRTLAPVLGVDAATVSRRWTRMHDAGLAWVTAHPAGAATPICALVEITCEPGRSRAVADTLAADVQAATVKITSGTRNVIIVAQAPDLDALSSYLLDHAEHIPGVTSVRSHLATHSTLEASRWRDGALDAHQRRTLRTHAPSRPLRAGLDAVDRRLVRALGEDGRMSFGQLSERVGLGPVAVKRRLTRLQEAGLTVFRCDSARSLSGRTVAAVFFCTLQVNDLDAAEERIRTVPGIRACTLVAGPFNVVIDAWLRSAEEVQELERELTRRLPTLQVQDRSVVLRTVKLLGRILDSEGRAVRAVPLEHDPA